MGHSNHSLHRYHLRSLHYQELGVLYLSRALKALALSLVALFVPIYLYELGYSLLGIALFFSVWFLVRVPFDLLGGFLTARFGPQHVMAMALIVLAGYLLGLVSLSASSWQFFLVALVGGLYHSLYWVAYHIDFSKIINKQRSGRELSWLAMLLAVVLAAGPLLGGLIAATFGPALLFIVAVALVLFIVPILFLAREPLTPEPFSFKGYPWRSLPKTGLWLSAIEIDTKIISTVWPLFIFLVLFSDNPYMGVGAVISAGLVFTLGVDYLIGRLCDGKGSFLVRRVSALSAIVIHSLRQFALSVPAVVAVNVAGETTNTGMAISHMSRHYKNANLVPRVAYITLNEAFASLAKAAFWLGLSGLTLLFSELLTLRVAFLVGAACLLPLVFARQIRRR